MVISKKHTLFALILISLALMAVRQSLSALPWITRPVNDYAGIISPAYERKITGMIVAHRKKTGVQMAVLTVWTTGNMSIEEYSLKTAEKWGGGSKERDDGLLFTVAAGDRHMRLEVGYGLEGYIPDGKARRILDSIRDDFRKKAYGRGIERVILEVISSTEGLQAGEAIPASGRYRAAFFHLFKYLISFCILGAIIGALFMILKQRLKFPLWVTIPASLLLFAGIPVLLQVFFPGVWYWRPVVFFTGSLIGAGMVGALTVPRSKVSAVIMNAIPALISLGGIIYCLHILKPLQEKGTAHESALLVILFFTNFFQLIFLTSFNAAISGTGGSYNSGGYSGYDSSSSYGGSSYSGSSDSGSSWSGDGGSFGGGGASSSW